MGSNGPVVAGAMGGMPPAPVRPRLSPPTERPGRLATRPRLQAGPHTIQTLNLSAKERRQFIWIFLFAGIRYIYTSNLSMTRRGWTGARPDDQLWRGRRGRRIGVADQLEAVAPQADEVQSYGRQRRCVEGRLRCVVEPDHADLVRHRAAGLPHGVEYAEREVIVAAQHGGHAPVGRERPPAVVAGCRAPPRRDYPWHVGAGGAQRRSPALRARARPGR